MHSINSRRFLSWKDPPIRNLNFYLLYAFKNRKGIEFKPMFDIKFAKEFDYHKIIDLPFEYHPNVHFDKFNQLCALHVEYFFGSE